jgi:hypothetical protein
LYAKPEKYRYVVPAVAFSALMKPSNVSPAIVTFARNAANVYVME